MVLGSPMKYVFLIGVAAMTSVGLLAACGQRHRDPEETTTAKSKVQSPTVAAQKFSIYDYQIALRSHDNRCQLDYSAPDGGSGNLPLAFPGPCDFVRDHRGQLLSYRYADAGDVNVLVVIGELSKGCGPVAQGILLRKSSLALSTRVARGPLSCPASGMDEAEFWLFSHPSPSRR